ncbi:hypothetical protein XELAEV_18021996mg [Xenopus laevis]|uniref:Cytochrome c oxidase subunit 8B, mitochondrial n=1 Tax=Xenopus laevis TaxID=8355 RepID=A0A974D2L4_XENLA|nr:hypothetical protein XELAEV_18021996mg [Xenopus laevis]
MPLFTRTAGLLRRAINPHVMSKAGIGHKPAKDALTPAEQSIALATMFVTVLVPSGWVLSHMEDYKHKPE